MDYAESGLDIQWALVKHATAYPDKASRPETILWGGREIRNSLRIACPARGRIRLEFRSAQSDIDQGVDVKVDGNIYLADGEAVGTLRTWQDDKFEDQVAYDYDSTGGTLGVWNVYRWRWPSGTVTEEKWTGNAGFWVERLAPFTFDLHCSPGQLKVPDFESLLVRVEIEER